MYNSLLTVETWPKAVKLIEVQVALEAFDVAESVSHGVSDRCVDYDGDVGLQLLALMDFRSDTKFCQRRM